MKEFNADFIRKQTKPEALLALYSINNEILSNSEWRELLGDAKGVTIDRADQAIFESLDNYLIVYRGGHSAGLSWTLSLGVAEHFAEKNNSIVIQKTINKSEVIGYINARREDEIIL